MTVHFVVGQVSSGPARNVKYLMPRLLVTRKGLMDRFAIDRASPWRWNEKVRACVCVCVGKNCGRWRSGGRAIFETRDRCVHTAATNNF